MKNLKNTFYLVFSTAILGSIFGTLLYNTYSKDISVFGESNLYYFLQEGAYSSKELVGANTKKLDTKLVVEEDGMFYVYVAITRDKDVRDQITSLYKEKNIELYSKEKSVKNEEFQNNIDQFDLLLRSSTTIEEINSISDVALSNYEQTMKKE